MSITQEWNRQMLLRLDMQENHIDYNNENFFYDMIATGNTEEVAKLTADTLNENRYEDPRFGRLSTNTLMNTRYHFVISVALVTRHCIIFGMPEEEAYTLSDLYIQKMDALMTQLDILKLHRAMALDFTRHMAELPKKHVYSIQTVHAINYVGRHYTEDINVESVANALNINRSFLSKIFAENTGQSLGSFIRQERVKAAGNMLRFSDYSCAQIAEYLHFSSQSHFISCFKKEMGETPAQYKKRNANLKTENDSTFS